MKKHLFCLSMLACIAFALPSCDNTDDEGNLFLDDTGFPTMSAQVLDTSSYALEFCSHDLGCDIGTLLYSPAVNMTIMHSETGEDGHTESWESSVIATFYHSQAELEESPYAPYLDKLPEIDWSNQTLVILIRLGNQYFINSYEGCSIYHYSNKYTVKINLTVPTIANCSLDAIGTAIILNEKGVQRDNVKIQYDAYAIAENDEYKKY